MKQMTFEIPEIDNDEIRCIAVLLQVMDSYIEKDLIDDKTQIRIAQWFANKYNA
ncbi:hypothetical protein LCGC14_1099430, partial [marine sediment metagenome]